jgi:hypothetical protein
VKLQPIALVIALARAAGDGRFLDEGGCLLSRDVAHSPHQERRDEMTTPKIKPAPRFATGKTGSLRGIDRRSIERRLGLKATPVDGDGKVTLEWSFTIEGSPCMIWNYKGADQHGYWSFSGSALLMRMVFGDEMVEG